MSGKRSMRVYEKYSSEGDWLTHVPFWRVEQQIRSRNPNASRARKAKRARK